MDDKSFGVDATAATVEALTFRRMAELDGNLIREQEPDTYQSALGEWFGSIVDTPLKSFTVGDVARSIRQDLFIDYLIPYALHHLESEPRAGYVYEGELLTALGFAPLEYWKTHDERRCQFLVLIDLAIESDYENDLDADTVKKLLRIKRDFLL